VLLLLARLGLRAGEVAAIELEDIDWRRGEFQVRGRNSLLCRRNSDPRTREFMSNVLIYHAIKPRGRPKKGKSGTILQIPC